MADDNKKRESEESVIDRRDTLKLVSAVAALGLGLGVTTEAEAQGINAGKIRAEDVGRFSIKLFKVSSSNSSPDLVETLDLSTIGQHKGANLAGQYSIKLYNTKGEATALLTENSVEIARRTKQ